MSEKALIGLTADFVIDQKYSDMPYYALRENYSKALNENGAAVILLPPIKESIDSYVSILDGIIITGGNFDINPRHYGVDEIHPETKCNDTRSNFEYIMAKKVIEREIPILGICGGMQLINVIYGGTLLQHIPDHKQFTLHEKKPYTEPAHDVLVTEGTILHSIVKKDKIMVNSSHHQAIDKVADNLVVSGKCSDGIIESLENPDYNFMLGVQWHPEYQANLTDVSIFHRFVDSCYEFKNSKS